METEQNRNDPPEDTDLYGRRITHVHVEGSDHEPAKEADGFDFMEINMVQRLQGSLTLAKKALDKGKEDQEILTYAETLHKGLKVMWVPMVYLGRMPFRLILKHNRAIVKVVQLSPAYIFCNIVCVLTWVFLIWVSAGLAMLFSNKDATYSKGLLNDLLTLQISFQLLKRYWVGTFIFWTTFLQACVSTTHVIYRAEDFALFIKAWYQVLDLTKIEVSRTLKQYIIKSQITIVLFVACVVAMFFLKDEFPYVRGTCYVIVIGFAQPIISIFDLKDHKTRFPDKRFYFEHYDFIGLIIYIMAILFSWLYIIQFMVFCRCFRKGLRSINQRIAMILNVNDEPRVGPNALRLTFEYIHKDYLGIATTGLKIGKIFSWAMCNYYLWTMLVIVAELGEIFKFAKEDYRKEVNKDTYAIFTEAGFQSRLPPVEVITADLLHFAVTTVCIFYVSYDGSGAHREGKTGYELARYKGLVDCHTQLERNFIRSIWIIVSDKCPVHVSPGKFFGITNSTVMTVFATAFTYFVFWVQSQGQLEGTGTTEEEGNTGLRQASLAFLADAHHNEDDPHHVLA